ncbi:hypothetical protein FQN54_009000 [Arachnomyces sp. PD_36]|nr:hypothetical protein FQN54_009000 [Arachnomyces sp. PD_36]
MEAYRAPSLFQPHRARQALRDAHDGKIPRIFAHYFGISSVAVARLVATMGFDAVWIDWEHTACDIETMTTMVHEVMFMSEGKTIPFVRVPGHDHASIGYALDAGASIVVPQVNTVAEAQHVVSSAKFGSDVRGTRSGPPFRLIPGITDTALDPTRSIYKNVNDQAAIMIQIETLEGVNNLDDILTQVPDIDAVWLGTLDLQISMGLNPTMQRAEQKDPEFIKAVEKYNEVCKKHDIPMGSFGLGTPEQVKSGAANNAFVCVASDVLGIMGQAALLHEAKEMILMRETS